MCVSGGDVAPLVGHNAFLRWEALQKCAFVDPADGVERFWSEAHVSEDFDLSLRFQARKPFFWEGKKKKNLKAWRLSVHVHVRRSRGTSAATSRTRSACQPAICASASCRLPPASCG
jgi:hypothetical protein